MMNKMKLSERRKPKTVMFPEEAVSADIRSVINVLSSSSIKSNGEMSMDEIAEKATRAIIFGDKLSREDVMRAKYVQGFLHSSSDDESSGSDDDPARDSSILNALFHQQSSGSEDEAESHNQFKEQISADKPSKSISSTMAVSDTNKVQVKLDSVHEGLLERVRFVRIFVDSLVLDPQSKSTVSSYVIEYQFPVSSSITKAIKMCPVAVESKRVFSNRASENTVTFAHRSVFPVKFVSPYLKHWLNRTIVFNVFMKQHCKERSMVKLGYANLPLKIMLASRVFSCTVQLPLTMTAASKNSEAGLKHFLKVRLDLASDERGFYSSLTNFKKSSAGSSKTKTSGNNTKSQHSSSTNGDNGLSTVKQNRRSPERKKTNKFRVNHGQSVETQSADEVVVNFLLSIPCGSGFVPPIFYQQRKKRRRRNEKVPGTRRRVTRNLYLECRTFNKNDVSRSVTSWCSLHPVFNFKQVIPVALNEAFLQRMRNNYLIVEVWDKQNSRSDELVGHCKLSLHQFYLSFRNSELVEQILQSQDPVIAVDGVVTVDSVFTNSHVGQLRVLMAMGTHRQINRLSKSGQFFTVDRESRVENNVVPQDDSECEESSIGTHLTSNVSADVSQVPSTDSVSSNPLIANEPRQSTVNQSRSSGNESFNAEVGIERAMRLKLKDAGEKNKINSYVTFTTVSGEETTPVAIANSSPLWNWSNIVRLPLHLLTESSKNLLFQVWHLPSDDDKNHQLIGYATVDLTVLPFGMIRVCGWYYIIDLNGRSCGQLKVSIEPKMDVTYLKSNVILNNQVDIISSDGIYCTRGSYSSFPTHISRYWEQNIFQKVT